MAFNKESFEHFWQHLDILFGKKVDKVAGKGLSSNDYTTDEKNKLNNLDTIINAPKDFIIFKDRSTGILYYGGMDNGNWVTWCDVDHIEVAPAIDNMIYIEGMKLSKEDFIVTAFYIDGSSRHITEYDLIVDEILTLDSTNAEVVFTFNGKSYSDNITFTVVELDPEIKNMLIDFQYDINRNNTYTLTDWYQTYNGNLSTELIIPDSPNIVL